MKSLLSRFLGRLDTRLIAISLVATASQGWPLLSSWRQTSRGLEFSAAFHDSLWHLGLIKVISQSFPPPHPGLSGLTLTNYHFISDAFLYLFTLIPGISAEHAYFRIGPVIAVLSFTTAAYLLSKSLTTTIAGKYASTILILFGGSLSWLVVIFKKNALQDPNIFMLDQPFNMLTNVHTYFGFAIFTLATSLIINFFNKPRSNNNNGLLVAGILIGSLFGIKAYASVIGIMALIATSAWLIISKRTLTFTTHALLPALIIAGGLYLATNSSNDPNLVFAPGWLLDKMIEDTDRLNLQDLVLRQQHYQETSNLLRIALITAQKLILYLTGNLGFRLIGLLLIISWFIRNKTLKPMYVFLATATFASLTIPLLFLQHRSAYNIVQFGQYALILTSTLTITAIEIRTRANKTLFKLILAITILAALPTTIKSISDYQFRPNQDSIISTDELQAIAFLKDSTHPTSIILTHPLSKHSRLMIIPGLAGRQTFFSGDTFAEITNANIDLKIKDSNVFFSQDTSLTNKLNFLKSAKINYIYLDVAHQLNIDQFSEELNLEKVFSNRNIEIYSAST